MKKIGLFIPNFVRGGAERVVSRLTTILQKDYDIYLILCEDTYMSYSYDGTLINMNIKSTKSPIKKIINFFKRIRKLKKIKKDYDLDCVISFLDIANVVNVLSKNKKTKVVISIRNFSELEKNVNLTRKLIDFFVKKTYKKADYVISVSNLIRDSYINNYGISKNKIITIYNPYNIEDIKKLSQEKLDKESENLIFEKKTIIAVGRIIFQKGYWHLIKAFNKLSKFYDVNLVILGDLLESEKLAEMIENNKMTNVFLLGPKENPYKYISKSTCFVMSSLFEGFPNALVEAMCCKKPIVSSDCKSGPREILSHESYLLETDSVEYAEYGILTKNLDYEEDYDINKMSDSDEALYQGLKAIIANNELATIYSQKALERAKSFSYETCLKKYKEVVENVINK